MLRIKIKKERSTDHSGNVSFSSTGKFRKLVILYVKHDVQIVLGALHETCTCPVRYNLREYVL